MVNLVKLVVITGEQLYNQHWRKNRAFWLRSKRTASFSPARSPRSPQIQCQEALLELCNHYVGPGLERYRWQASRGKSQLQFRAKIY